MSGTKLTNQQIYIRLSVLALLIASTLTLLAVTWKRTTIETQLAQQARKALTEADLPMVNVHFEGRDGILSGLLPREAALDTIIQAVAEVYGVRTVQNQLTLTDTRTDQAVETINSDTGLHVPSRAHPLEQLDLSGIEFVYAQAVLTESSQPVLEQLIELLKKYPQTRIEVSAHTDNQGTVLGQMAASQARAEAVVQYLLDQGIKLDRLSAKGYGATRPVSSNDDEAGRNRNRRVEITVLKE